jgi:NAD(P)-dependent dehydrogenase (short-subunit alcohol dehydrogenase family)
MSPKFAQSINQGTVVLVTAGANGIGRVMAEAFLARDCAVHVCDIDPAAVSDFLDANPNATATVADVADTATVGQVFSELESRHGRLDVLVNNAGIAGPVAAVEEVAPRDWDRVIAVNLSSHFYYTREAVPMLKRAGGGSVIMMSSSAAFMGCPLRTPYSAAKWGLIGLVKTLAMELGPFGIRVNAICPGSVNGERIRSVMEREAQSQGRPIEEVRERYLGQNSMRTFVEPGDVANMALYLASDAGAKISGQALGLDGNTESFAI